MKSQESISVSCVQNFHTNPAVMQETMLRLSILQIHFHTLVQYVINQWDPEMRSIFIWQDFTRNSIRIITMSLSCYHIFYIFSVFVSQDQLAGYLSQHTICETDSSSGTVAWSCAICNKYLNKKYDVLRHIESLHVETDPYLCLYCSQQFKTRRSVQRHTLAVHKTNQFQ